MVPAIATPVTAPALLKVHVTPAGYAKVQAHAKPVIVMASVIFARGQVRDAGDDGAIFLKN